MVKIQVAICWDCGKPHWGRSNALDRCWCDTVGRWSWGEIDEEDEQPSADDIIQQCSEAIKERK